jgi:hypothetical protein
MSTVLLDAAGRRRSPARCRASAPADRRATRAVANPADLPTVEDIVAVGEQVARRVLSEDGER